MTVRVGQRTLLVDGREVPVYSGAVHYWRLDRASWPLILDRARDLGFRMVETYIPWSVHETARGVIDWGQSDPRKDVEAFARLCEERGLWLLVRPGPLINAELTDFGFPEWVLLDPEVQSRTALDTLHLDAAWGLHPPHQFPVPSYASERFYEYVAGWFDAVCPIIARHLAPDGCVVAVQSDNETCYLFHDQAYATDYHPDSIRLYQEYLRERHADIDRLNACYGAEFQGFGQVQPPRDGEIASRTGVPWRIDWVAYKEYQIRWSVARLARMLRERGLGAVPIFHDVAFQYRTPLDLARMEDDPDIDWVGLNFYRSPQEHTALVDRVRFLAGSTRLPFVPELGAGRWSHHALTPLPDEEEFSTLSMLMYGVKAFNLYMLVERERWQGSPITRHGAYRDDYAEFYRRLMSFLQQVQFWRFQRRPRALVLLSFDLGRYAAASSLLDTSHADLLGLPEALFDGTPDLGFRCDIPAESRFREDSWPRQVMHALQVESIDFDLADTHLSAERLARYPVVFAQAVDFMAEADQRLLRDFARAGGKLLMGPGVPYLDQYFRSCALLDGTAMPPAAAAKFVQPAEYRASDPRLEVVPHYADDGRVLLFVANPTASPVAVGVVGTSVWRQSGGDLPPYSIDIFDVTA